MIKADEDVPVVDAAEAGVTEDAAPTPMEVDKEKQEESKNQTPVPSKQPTPQPPQPQQPGQGQQPAVPSQQQQQPVKDAAPQIDLLLEASKLPLDVAIFNSARAAGGDDKIRKYLQAVLVVGGTALTPGMAHALESRYASFVPRDFYERKGWGKEPPLIKFLLPFLFSSSEEVLLRLELSWNDSDDRLGGGRLQAIATPLIQNMEKVQIIPPPKDVDKRVLTWKGASVLGRMEGVTDMWVTGADWVRGEHEFFLPCPSRSL